MVLQVAVAAVDGKPILDARSDWRYPAASQQGGGPHEHLQGEGLPGFSDQIPGEFCGTIRPTGPGGVP